MPIGMREISSLVVSVLLLAVAPTRAAMGLPGIPGIPGIPNPQTAAKGYASKQIVKAMGDAFSADQPVRVSLADAFPTVEQLPGGRFHAAPQATVERLFSTAHDGRVHLPVGDYAVSVMTYCMNVHAHAPHRNTFHLAPIRGKWADIVAALNGRVGTRYSPLDVQVLSWSLQAGMKYSELSGRSRQIVDAVIPDFKPRMQQSFIEELRSRWSQLTSTIPGVPSFEQSLTSLGDVGKAIQQIIDARNTLIANANDYDRIVAEFANPGNARVSNGGSGATPWSIIAPGVYARLRNRATFMSTGVLQVRVTAQAASTAMQVASSDLRGLGRSLADASGPEVPIPSYAGAPTAAVQPLGMTPQPGQDPPPSDTEPGASPGPGNDDDDGDTSSPCDPPNNMFGVDNGTSTGSSAAGMQVGRGTGHGIVCLLLRPTIDLSQLGWPHRGSAEVDWGSVAYGVPGHPQPGHVVVIAHYTYATTSSLTNPVIKHDVTAVIDYSGVSTFCPELVSTLALHNDPSRPNWLSAAELENRLCITGMTGPTIQINASMLDGTTVGPYSNAHAIDPQGVLYADFWGHM